mmetsp:Transcript_19581/g.21884  ORF Transcript_19581/g.21884 Transcript_19581/m.21884 type:complete len:153 (+) Transcript_19581:15-473(+)
MMKIVLLLSILTLGSCSDHYWGIGDNLLEQLQSGSDEIIAVTLINPNPIVGQPDKENENRRVEFGMEHEIIEELNRQPLNIKHTVVDVTDQRNAHLLYKLRIKPDMADIGPVVLITQKGSGYSNWGPTILHRVSEVIKTIQADAAKEGKSRR